MILFGYSSRQGREGIVGGENIRQLYTYTTPNVYFLSLGQGKFSVPGRENFPSVGRENFLSQGRKIFCLRAGKIFYPWAGKMFSVTGMEKLLR